MGIRQGGMKADFFDEQAPRAMLITSIRRLLQEG
jgi:hypothetical protein